jgi:hypothetical protein
MVLGPTQPLREMSTRNLSGRKGRPALKADNLTAICLESVAASTSHNPMGLRGLLQGWLYFVHRGAGGDDGTGSSSHPMKETSVLVLLNLSFNSKPLRLYVKFEAFTANKCYKIFSGHQSY